VVTVTTGDIETFCPSTGEDVSVEVVARASGEVYFDCPSCDGRHIFTRGDFFGEDEWNDR
jgi:hypothetical protein